MNISELFPQIKSIGISVDVEKISIDRENRSMLFDMYFEKFDPAAEGKVKQILADGFAPYNVEIRTKYPSDSLTPDSVKEVVSEMEKTEPVNGFFDGCNVTIDGRKVAVELCHGGLEILNGLDIPGKLSRRITEKYGIVTEVTLSCPEIKHDSGTAAPQYHEPLYDEPVKRDYGTIDSPLGPMSGNIEGIYGHGMDSMDITAISALDMPKNNITVCGYLFKREEKTTRRGDTIIEMGISDYTSSCYMKIIISSGKPQGKLGQLKPGDLLIVFGNYKFDDFINDNIFMPKSIARTKLIEKTDNAPEKRIELHLHTNMSTLDGMSSPADAVKLAYKYGHKAIAITDHAVLQAFPDVANEVAAIRKQDPERGFKAIYGVEAYYVDDRSSSVHGTCTDSLDEDIVVFDLETTGFYPHKDRIIEIGAVILHDGKVTERFSTFVNPKQEISSRITELTGITNDMVAGAPYEEDAVPRFMEFIGNKTLCAHNADFDTSFIRSACERLGIAFENPYIDTVNLTQCLYPDFKKYTLDAVTNSLGLPGFKHHRADDDAAACALILAECIKKLKTMGASSYSEINDMLNGINYKHARTYHMSILVKNSKGLNNLYHLVSESNLNYYFRRPRIPLSALRKYREGLLLGSGCELGEIISSMTRERSRGEILELAKKYDYIEVQPPGNYTGLLKDGSRDSYDELQDMIKEVISIADELHIPVVATGDVHYLKPHEQLYRKILTHNLHTEEADVDADLTFKTTDEMLDAFSFLGEERAKEIVIDNPAKLARLVEDDLKPIPNGTFTPYIDNAEETLKQIAEDKFNELYGKDAPELFRQRKDKELESIIRNGFAVLYVIAQKLVFESNRNGYQVGSRGSVGSSLIANLVGISEVNPLPAHYRCKECGHIEMLEGVDSGFDVENSTCPICGGVMVGDGHNIPFETFLGFHGEKAPDIDLNFSGEYQSKAHKFTEVLFGSENVFKAGTVSAIQTKTAFGYVKKYLEENNITVTRAEEERLAVGCTGVKRTTGQHPGGMVVVPSNYEIQDFTAVQHPADSEENGIVTTHFDFTSMHDTLLKLDELGHDVPTMYKYLEDFTGIPVDTVPMNDRKVFDLFLSLDSLGIKKEDIDCPLGTLGIPEFGTRNSVQMLLETKPQKFSDLLQISGLSHGTDVWHNNAQDLIKNGTCTISEVIGTRDGIMTYLIGKGVEPSLAFEIMELTRKGKAATKFTSKHTDAMLNNNVPQWYLDSCLKIKYMFPKAHAAAYVTAAIRLAWYKVYKPLEFYATFFTVRGEDIDVDAALGGLQEAKKKMAAMRSSGNKLSAKEEDVYFTLQVTCEMLARGFKFLPVDVMKSHATKYQIENGSIRLPFIALKGVGGNAANSLYTAAHERPLNSAEDLLAFPGISASMIDMLDSIGALGDLPKSSQMSLF